ncbi:hypothetical protein AGABI1DRAFT_42617 [Agaricus bisporus var. burnettii JB137-S8]|uniref:Uncharacterized protein n=1 Tax=Agaricus bisporus var. burnettii (strain JB137-S8 / ATCC MYA-4627 / FGSC 10392) TaxID=597362 RepID=K5VTY8_AGABU|nr:uncharacterized protein AGABI1DRAFT_42617 [Agaricus bisporus var. burnettii JB137-S8]EKM77929.1 hypothetical protein AGABI1DRAFT_42617 [Agaricus bisporus var. burnettii JB137-S8]
MHSELHTPGSFMGLVSLKIETVPLADDHVLNFHHLPDLQYLSLRDTCISNTAVYLLSSHRRTLLSLDIGDNSDIDDDAIAPLLNFKKLKYLNMIGTDVTMDGLRRYAKAIHEAKRVIHIDIPEECEQKLQNLGHLYLVDIPPPFISDPDALENLTLAEIRANLNAHWEVNKRIVTTGNKNDLRERLKELLARRKDDLLVKEMVENGRDGGAEFNNRGDADDK